MTQHSSTPRAPVAIVGASALFPGSLDATGFWQNILQGRDLMTDVPASHWLIEDYYDPDPSVPDKTYAKRGAFLPEIDFDAMRWGIPPNIVPETDTSQLLALIVAQRVLEDASRGQPGRVDRSRTSVILGVTSGQELLGSMVSRLQRPIWVRALREAGMPESQVTSVCERIAESYTDWNESTFPGLLGNVVAGRIANRLDLGGTNCVSDAACASSMSALSMGLNELHLGDSDLVITGGVDTMNDIFMFMCFSKTPALSASGDCRPFSDNADGTMLGEGLGMVALKRLADAERDGDKIYGVIRGCGASSDGRSKSVYAPVSSGQANALRRAYDQAGYGPKTVELIEAHGTGTRAGDAAEFGGLRMVFEGEGAESSDAADQASAPARQWCQLGTVKSQIGHTKSAAGAAGLLKALMALHHRVLPPTIKVERPNPALELENSAFHLTTRARPWVRGSSFPRRASVSAFGFGGSNFHVALEEAPGSDVSRRAPRLHAHASTLIAASAQSAKALLEHLAAWSNQTWSAESLRWTAHESRSVAHHDASHRVAMVVDDVAAFEAALRVATDMITKSPETSASSPAGVHYGVGPVAGQLAFLFPGQGSQYLDMGADLAMHFDEALSVWDAAADLELEGGRGLHDVVFPITAFDSQTADGQRDDLAATEHAQPALGCASVAALALLRAVGVKPDCVAGHSFGELTALHAAGVWSQEQLLAAARKRGLLMAEAASVPGAMTAVTCDAEALQSHLASWQSDVVIANHNAPTQVVLSGTSTAIEAVETRLKAEGLRFKRLPVATAFHSKVVAGASAALESYLQTVDSAEATLPVYGNLAAAPYGDASVASTLGEQLASRVRFVEMIEAMYAAGVRTFVEVGPGSVLRGLVARILGDRPHRAINTDRKGRNGVTSMLDALAQLTAAGRSLNMEALWSGHAACTDPALEAVPKLALKLTGSNYGKPYPPASAADNPPPNPEPSPRAAAVAPAAAPVAPTPISTSAEPHMTPKPAAKPSPAPAAAAPVAVATQSAAPAANPVPLNPGWAALWEETQRETARAHTAYLESMADSHRAFLRTVEQGFGLAAGAGEVPTVPAHAPAPRPVAVAPAPQRAPDVTPVAARPVAPQPAAPQPAPRAAETLAVVAPAVERPAVAAVPAAPSVDLEAVMLKIVAEKTGYPAEMLAMEMSLEADLGIDSIKRVEILSAVQEAAPGLPEVDTSVLAKLQTLGEITEHMQSLLGPVSTGAAAVPAAPSVDLEAVMLKIVAEKTGYPAEMLAMEMSLEADLGIDSIKRVEILSAVQEAAPGLPEVDTSVLAKLQTLGEITEHMQSLLRPVSTGAAAVAAAPSVDLEAVMLKIVAEKTGYPAEMLAMEMSLEADLGIDSIKRVEILSAVQEAAPGLPEVDTSVLAKLQTLGEITEHMQSLLGPVSTGAAAVPAAPSVDLEAVMLKIVAEKTGYPAEMLAMEMSLEADLGIDSIKRVEILSAVQEAAPGLPEVDTSVLAKLQTLGEITEHMQSLLGPVSSEDTRADVVRPAGSESTAALGRWVLSCVPQAAPGLAMRGLASNGPLAVSQDGTGLAQALVAALDLRGIEAVVIDDHRSLPAGCRGLIFLGGMRPTPSVQEAVSINTEAFEAAGALARHTRDTGGVAAFVVVQDTGGAFGTQADLDPTRAWSAGGAALARTAAAEWPEASVRILDVQRGPREESAVADAIAAELAEGGSALEVGLSASGQRVIPQSVSTPVDTPAAPLPAGSVIVASGGARGVTAATLIALAGEGAYRFVLLGRTPCADEPPALRGAADDAAIKRVLMEQAAAEGRAVSPKELGAQARGVLASREIRATLKAIEEAGSVARYASVSVTDAAALTAILEDVRAQWGPISALVHGAGVIEDRFIVDKTPEAFARVFDTKVAGLRALLEATSDDPLQALCLFSSVAARYGNAGQADYAMANEVLNKVAWAEAARRGASCCVKSLGWGPWQGGMVTPQLERHFASLGVALIPQAVGAQMLLDELRSRAPGSTEVVLGGAPQPGAFAPAGAGGHLGFADVVVDRRTHPFLHHHSIKGTPVVPVAFAIEWFSRAARAAHPELVLVGLREVSVLRGIPLADFDRSSRSLQVHSTPKSTETGVAVALELRDPAGTVYYRATAELAQAASPPQPVDDSDLGLETWGDRVVYDGDVLFHGPEFQVIRSIDGVSSKGMSAHMGGVLEAGWPAAWATDPLALDGGLQLALLWSRHVLGGSSLPTAISSVRTFGTAPVRGPLRCTLRGRTAEGSKTVSDMIFQSEDGVVVAELQGVETHQLPGQ